MEQNILDFIKKNLIIFGDIESFNDNIITILNAVKNIVKDLGVITKNIVINEQTKFSDIYATDLDISLIKLYYITKVKTIFDPPSNTNIKNSLNSTLSEMEYRILLENDLIKEEIHE